MTNHEKKTSRSYSVQSESFQKLFAAVTDGSEYNRSHREIYDELQAKVERGEITLKQAWMWFNYYTK